MSAPRRAARPADTPGRRRPRRSSLAHLFRARLFQPGRRPAAPPVDADEEEQPDDVDEMPVPGRRLEAEVMVRLEMPGPGAEPADDQEGGADDDMEAVEAGRHEEGRGVDAVLEGEGGVAVLEGL